MFATLFVAIDWMTNIVRYDVTASALASYYSYYVFEVLYQMLPVGCLVGTVFSLTSMSRANELVALFSSGMSLFRIGFPILFLVTIISVMAFFFGDQVLPKFIKNKNYIYYVDIKKTPGLVSTVKTDRVWYKSQNMIFNLKTINSGTQQAQGVTLYFFDPKWHMLQMAVAESVSFSGRKWDLNNGALTLFSKESPAPLTQKFEKKTILVGPDLADMHNATDSAADAMSLSELRRYIERNKEAGLDTLNYEVDFHAKFSFAFASIVMCLIGIPFTVGKARSGSMTMSVGLCVGLAFFYWVGYSSGITLARHGTVPPILSVWAPNMIMLVMSLFFIFKLRK